MPHLGEVQARYKDKVTIIGVSDEKLSTVVEFLAKPAGAAGKVWYDQVGFAMATDPDQSVKNDYFKAAGQRGIPSAFIVKDHVVEWIGHPMTMDEPLEAIVNGTWDREAFKARREREQAMQREMREVQAKLNEALRSDDYETALGILDGLLTKYPDEQHLLMQKFNVLLLGMHAHDEAYEVGQRIVELGWDNSSLLNTIAWTIVDDPKVQIRDLDLAMKAAVRANELTHSKNAAILDTLARAHYEKGELQTAVKWQRLAVEHAPDNEMGEQIRDVLKKYEAELRKRESY